jgi:5-methylcytosine-specific restriction endonuclease McrA
MEIRIVVAVDTCQECGVRGGTLNANHILSWRDHPESRYDVTNGRTLCDACHRKTPNYGSKAWRHPSPE